MEAARVWMLCRDLHLHARRNHQRWPDRDNLQQATKGAFSLHSQTVQMICHAFLANVETCHQVRQHNPKMRYPYKDKRFYPLLWPAQTVRVERGRVVLPMGRGRSPLILHVRFPSTPGRASSSGTMATNFMSLFPTFRLPNHRGQCMPPSTWERSTRQPSLPIRAWPWSCRDAAFVLSNVVRTWPWGRLRGNEHLARRDHDDGVSCNGRVGE